MGKKYTAKDDEEVYFDCNVLEKFDEKMHEFDSEKPKGKQDVDVLDFISHSDLSSVGG